MQGLRPIIDRINTAEERRAAETFRFMEEQKIRKAYAPRLWDELKQEFKKQCEAVVKSSSVRLLCEENGINELKVSAPKTGSAAVLTLNIDVPCIFYRTPHGNGEIRFGVSVDKAFAHFTINDSFQWPEGIVETIISQVLA